MTTIERLRAAVLARDVEQLDSLFADDARFYSPMKFSPLVGRAALGTVFRVLLTSVFDDFRYIGDLSGTCETGSGGTPTAHALVFRATVGDRQVHGLDLVHLNESGLIEEFTVMLRPRNGLDALAERMHAGLVREGVLKS
ncbi:nuclear transport factor 2 family protein [Tsukamurella sp. 1534]|uniref:nuclear transport factor 2 family protein n=1 Tax=Tsukamurella sp. 1534 TaxID=1151061 RepID=UPI000309E96C|nr:nuclear transport factor 2 family protein [Tsukamurella sp. 1534]